MLQASKCTNVTRAILFAVLVLAVLPGLIGCESRDIVVESVNAYNTKNGPPLANSIANGDGFATEMTRWKANGLRLKTRLVDIRVFDTDFVDPDIAVPGADTAWFDQSGVMFSYFTGHGGNGQGEGASQFFQQVCSTSAQCTRPNAAAGESLPGSCKESLRSPLTPFVGFFAGCTYNTNRFLLTDSPSDRYGGIVNYSGGSVKLGESSDSGPWAGAGTNGGANLVVLDISHGVQAPFWAPQLQPAMAGVRLLATILTMPVDGDTANSATRGPTFARALLANKHGSAAGAWLETLNNIPQRDSGPCGGRDGGDYSNGGGHGINGCGCNFIITFDVSPGDAAFNINNESLTTLQKDSGDAKGTQFWHYRAMCNYQLRNDRFDLP